MTQESLLTIKGQRPTTNGQRPRANDRPRRSERGYILLMLMLFVTLMVIAAGVVAPTIAFRVRRDREEEMIHRGTQYSRAIQRYVKKTGRYPSRLEDLENTNNIRFLRRRYKDPVTGKDFKLLHVGEVQLTSSPGIAGASPIGGPAAQAGGAALLGAASTMLGGAATQAAPGAARPLLQLLARTRPATRARTRPQPIRIRRMRPSPTPVRRAGLAALNSPAQFSAAAPSSAWPASARQRRFASSITRTITTSGSSSTTQPWTAAA